MKKWVRFLIGIIGLLIIAVVVGSINAATGAGVICALVIPGFTDEQSKSFSEFIEKQSGDIQGKVKELIANLKDTELIKGIQGILNGEGEKKGIVGNMELMQKQLDDISLQLEKDKKKGHEEVVSFAKGLREKMTAEIAKIKGMTEKNAASMILEVKSFLETANASITTGSLIPTPQFESGVSKAPDRMPFMLDLVSKGVASSMTIYWTQRKTRTDGTEWTAEGVAAANPSVLGYETKSASMQNLSEFIKVSNNSFDDIEWLLSEIQGELVTLLTLKLDADILNGTIALNGFDGVNVLATAFSAGGKTLKIGVNPNNYDVLKFAAKQIKKAHFRPNYVVLNPDDLLDLELERDDDGGYLWPPYLQVQPQFAGIQIVENTGVTTGTYLIGDFSKAKWWNRKGIELKIWEQNENDVLTQMKTITLYMRGTLIVKDVDKLAFVKGTFADDIETLRKV